MSARDPSVAADQKECIRLGRDTLIRANSETEPLKKLGLATESMAWFMAADFAEEVE